MRATFFYDTTQDNMKVFYFLWHFYVFLDDISQIFLIVKRETNIKVTEIS